jgi:membrane-bound lytic murein transglycosylase A
MTEGSTMSLGYDGTTNYPYVSIGGELIKDGVFAEEELSLPKLIAYFAADTAQLDQYIPRNNRFIFFRETDGAPPTGSLGSDPLIGNAA